MPDVAPRKCTEPSCRNVTANGGRCVDCRRALFKQIDERRASSTDRGYDGVHQRLRVLCFERDGFRCRECGWEPDVIGEYREMGLGDPPTGAVLMELRQRFNRHEEHLHADHVIPIEARADLRHDLDNYQTLCNRCHSAKTQREQLLTR